ncbi:MAG: hypothetical protein ACJAZ8_001873 [Planctomycetota bacterium]|jgi:hypothetical protein
MNPTTLDFQLTAIDRALAGLLEERLRLLHEAHPQIPREPDMQDIAGNSSYRAKDLGAIFDGIHRASLSTLDGIASTGGAS